MYINLNGLPGFKTDDGILLSPIDKVEELLTLETLYKQKKFNGLEFSNQIYWNKKDLEVVTKFPKLKYLELNNPSIKDYSALAVLRDLEILGIGEHVKQPIDLSLFPKLKKLWFVNSVNKFKNIISCKNLERLRIEKLKMKSKDFSTFPQLKNLKQLHISGCNVESLKGIENFPMVEEITFHFFKNLVDLNNLSKLKQLKTLWLEGAKKIQNHEVLGKCLSLEDLRLLKSSPIKNIASIVSNKSLKEFVFLDTDVLGGDLSPLLDRVWEYCCYTNKRHFSHKYTQIPAKIYSIKGDLIPPSEKGKSLH